VETKKRDMNEFILIVISLSNLVRIMKSFTDRHMGNSLKEVLIRDEMEKRVKKFFRYSRDKETKISDMFCSSHVCTILFIMIQERRKIIMIILIR
jgi:hypothetical protein